MSESKTLTTSGPLNEELLARVRQQAGVAAFGQRALTSADLGSLMDEAASLVAEMLGVEYCKVLELLPDGKSLLLRSGVGWKEGYVGRATVEADTASQAGYTLLSRGPVMVEDLRTETRFSAPPLLREHDVVSGLSVVIGEPERPYGVLGAHTAKRRTFTRDDVNFLQSITNVLAAAVERHQTEGRLREGEERFRTLADSAPVLIWVNGLQGCEFVNRNYLEFLGRSIDEVLDMDWMTAVHPDDVEGYVVAYRRAFEAQEPFEAQFRFRRADGEYRWLKSSGQPRFSAEGVFQGYVGSSVDVTDLKNSEEALRQSRSRLSGVIESAMDAIVTLDAGQRVVIFNRAAEQMFNCPSREAMGRPLDRFIPPRYREGHGAYIREFGQTGVTTRAMAAARPVYGLRADGEEFPIEASISQIGTGEGKLYTVIIRDITERKRAEERIREQAALLDEAQDAIMVRDLAEDRVLFWNRGAERLYGWTAAEAVGQRADDLFFRDTLQQAQEARRVFDAQGEWRGEFHQVTKSGREVVVESRWTRVRRDETGRPRSMLVVNTDITERKRLEADFQRAAQLSLMGELAAGLAHEIKNPLAGIKGIVDVLIRRRRANSPEREPLEKVRREVLRLDETVRTLLDRARPRALKIAPASLADVARRALILARHQIAGTGRLINISFEPPAEPLVLPLDEALLEDAVLNLILNAIEAIDTAGRITVRVYGRCGKGQPEGRDEAVVEVEDTGRGIPVDELQKIFSPFFSKGGGSGLGLAAVRRVAQAHGGSVEVQSTVGRGSHFRIRLPSGASDEGEARGAEV